MSFREHFGRCLLVAICVLSGIGQFSDPSPHAKTLSTSYSKTFAKVKEFGFKLPLAPELVSTYSTELIYLTAGLLLLGSVLTIFNKQAGSCLLSTLLLSFCAIIHNPYLFPTEKEALTHLHMLLMNLGLVAGLCLTCGKKASAKAKVE